MKMSGQQQALVVSSPPGKNAGTQWTRGTPGQGNRQPSPCTVPLPFPEPDNLDSTVTEPRPPETRKTAFWFPENISSFPSSVDRHWAPAGRVASTPGGGEWLLASTWSRMLITTAVFPQEHWVCVGCCCVTCAQNTPSLYTATLWWL
jgi:hypothetical protein